MPEYLVQYHVLHTASEHATAHQPRIDLPAIGLARTAYDDADHAVVAEPVYQADLKGKDGWVMLRVPDLGLCIAPRSEVVLIRLVDELGNACPTGGVERLKGYGHFQGSEIGLDPSDL